MKTVISMKMIMIDDWSLHNKLKASMLIEPSVGDLEVYLEVYVAFVYFVCSPGRLDRLYYRLVNVLHNTLYGDDYFDEDN